MSSICVLSLKKVVGPFFLWEEKFNLKKVNLYCAALGGHLNELSNLNFMVFSVFDLERTHYTKTHITSD